MEAALSPGWSRRSGIVTGLQDTEKEQPVRGEKPGQCPKAKRKEYVQGQRAPVSRGSGHLCPILLGGPDRGRQGRAMDLATWSSKVTSSRADLGESGTKAVLGWIPG